MRIATKNKILFVCRSTMFNLAALCLTGTLMQGFLGEVGLGNLVFIHATLLSASNVLTTVFLSHFADGTSRLFRRMVLCQAPIALFYLFYIPLCVADFPSGGAFALAAAVGIIQSFFAALCNVCDYKLPYRIIPVEEYGEMSAASGIVIALSSIGVGQLFSRLVHLFPYRTVMLFAFPVAALLTAGAAILTAAYRPCETAAGQEEKGNKVPLRELFRTPVFTVLLLPNLFRGMASGVVSVLAAVALMLGHSAAFTSCMVPIQSAAMLATCLLFGVFSRRLESRVTVFLGSILMLALPLLLLPGETTFLVVFTVVFAGRNLVDYSTPAALYRVVPDRIAGPYNAWRLILHSGGSLIATSLAAFLPVPVLLVSAAVLQIVSGFFYLLARPLRRTSRRTGT